MSALPFPLYNLIFYLLNHSAKGHTGSTVVLGHKTGKYEEDEKANGSTWGSSDVSLSISGRPGFPLLT